MSNTTPTERSSAQSSPLPPPWTPPARSVAQRNFKLGNKGALTGEFTTDGPDAMTIIYESHLEKKVLVALLAHRDVVEVREQVGPVEYVDALGETALHYFDFVATLRSGERMAVFVKPSRMVKKYDLKATLGLIARCTPRSVADRVVLRTEEHVTRDIYHDAQLILDARAIPNSEHDRRIASIAESLNGVTTVQGLVSASELNPADAFASVVRLIGSGLLRIVGQRRICLSTNVARVAAGSQGAL